jgi:hypothetical protein
MKNVEDLRDALSEVFDGLKDGSIKPKEAAEFANLAGKMINSAKVQVEYSALRKESPTIAFLTSRSSSEELEIKCRKH